mmetsp:Transcript_6430/g.12846  ORF Transcript_6430/g.12846 Transcript_6430/m.12846 type:complete len:134 (-) Transcript_6430:571-972(-)
MEMREFVVSRGVVLGPDEELVGLSDEHRRLAVLRFFVDRYRKPVPSHIFPALETVADVMAYFERAMQPPPPTLPHLRDPAQIPSNLTIDPQTFATRNERPTRSKRRPPILFRKPSMTEPLSDVDVTQTGDLAM